MTDPFVGKLTFFRVYSGVLTSGSYVLNSTKNTEKKQEEILKKEVKELEIKRSARRKAQES